MRSTYAWSTLPLASCTQPALRKNRRRAYSPGWSGLSIFGLTYRPLPESPVPIRCACESQTFAESSPSHALRTSSWSASRAGRRARQGFQKPCSGQKRQAASAAAPAKAAPPSNRLRRFRRKEGLGGPILDVALEHLVL